MHYSSGCILIELTSFVNFPLINKPMDVWVCEQKKPLNFYTCTKVKNL